MEYRGISPLLWRNITSSLRMSDQTSGKLVGVLRWDFTIVNNAILTECTKQIHCMMNSANARSRTFSRGRKKAALTYCQSIGEILFLLRMILIEKNATHPVTNLTITHTQHISRCASKIYGFCAPFPPRLYGNVKYLISKMTKLHNTENTKKTPWKQGTQHRKNEKR